MISLLWASLAPVRSVTAQAGLADVTHLILRHDSGVTSTATVTLNAPVGAEFSDLFLWGQAGRSAAPMQAPDPVTPLRTALAELAANARSGQVRHPCDARFGRDVVRVLADAERQVSARSPSG